MCWIKKFVSIQHIRKQSVGPNCFFLTLLDILNIAAYSASVLFNLWPSVQDFNSEQRACYKFLSTLGEALIKPNIIARSQFTIGLHTIATQAIQTSSVEIQPQAIG